LIELARRIVFNPDELGDTPSCLSSNSDDLSGRVASITGYGETEEGNDAGKRLGTVNVTLVDYQTCYTELENYLTTGKKKDCKRTKFCDSAPYGMSDQQICGRGKAVCTNGEKIYGGACKGDSGSPVEAMLDGKRTVVGIISGSLACNSNLPEWFTNVAYYRDWITCIIESAKGSKRSKEEVLDMCQIYVKEETEEKTDLCNRKNSCLFV